MIAALADDGAIRADPPLRADQIQPASLDLRLGDGRLSRARELPARAAHARSPSARRAEAARDSSSPTAPCWRPAASTSCRCSKAWRCRADIAAAANPKSSTGRLDVFTRVIADGRAASTRSRPAITARSTPRSARGRFRSWCARARGCRRSASAAATRCSTPTALRDAARSASGWSIDADADVGDGIAVGIDLAGSGRDGLVGYRAKRHTGLIDVDAARPTTSLDFWEPIAARADKSLILDPDEFYILASKEAVQVPPDYAAEMVPFDPLVGEFRVHYAGFFDPGFGYAGAGGTRRARRAGGALARGAVHPRARPDRRPPGLREDAGAAGHALRPGHRLELPGAGPEAVEAFPHVSVRQALRVRRTKRRARPQDIFAD